MLKLDNKAKIKQIDLKAFFRQQVTLRKVSSQQGGGYSGPCPICGGNDRFMIYPALGICLCRHCSPSGKWEDIISFTSRMRGTGFQETCEYLLSVADGLLVADVVEMEHQARQEPSPEFRRAGEEVVRQCVENLWAPEGTAVREYLHQRYLTDETLKRWRIGYSSQWQVIEGLNVPPGIIIPWYFEGVLWHLKARVNEKKEGTKYRAITWKEKEMRELHPGGRQILFGDETLKGKNTCVVCEGEFDAMLLDQEAGDLVGSVTLGDCLKVLDVRAIQHLIPMNPIYIAYDVDDNEAGQKGAQKMKESSERMIVVNVPWGNDLTDFKQKGGDMREWVKSFISEQEPETAPIHDELPKLSPVLTSDCLRALNTRIAVLEAEYAAMDGVSAPSPEWTVYQDLSENVLLPAEVREQYRSQAETLQSALTDEQRKDDEKFWHCRDLVAQVERLRQERDQALEEGRSIWEPGPADELLRQQKDGSSLPAELNELGQAAPAPTEITVTLGAWNRRILKRDKVKVRKDSMNSIVCELI